MCNRYTLHSRDEALEAIAHAVKFGEERPDWTFNPRYNITPETVLPVFVDHGDAGAAVRAMSWGIVPSYERGKPRPVILTNLRAETLRQKGAFKKSVAGRRCLVPATGYFE